MSIKNCDVGEPVKGQKSSFTNTKNVTQWLAVYSEHSKIYWQPTISPTRKFHNFSILWEWDYWMFLCCDQVVLIAFKLWHELTSLAWDKTVCFGGGKGLGFCWGGAGTSAFWSSIGDSTWVEIVEVFVVTFFVKFVSVKFVYIQFTTLYNLQS